MKNLNKENSKLVLAEIIQLLPDAAFIINTKGKVIAWNKAMEELTNIKAEDILDKSSLEYSLPFYGEKRPILINLALNPQKKIEKKYLMFKRKKDTLIAETYVPFLRKGGSYLWAKACPLYDFQGNIIGAIELIRDITNRKNTELKLKESEKKYRELFNHMSSGVAVYVAINDCKDFILKDINKSGENISRRKKEKVIGRNVIKLFPGVIKSGLLDVFKKVWKIGEPMHHLVTLYRDGRISHWMENYVYKVPSGEIVSVFNNITNRKKTEEKLIKSEKNLRKKVLEINCLYEIIRLINHPTISIDELLGGTLKLIPNAWQIPELICARIFFWNREYKTQNYQETPWKISSSCFIGNKELIINVYYLEERKFIKEEEVLLKKIRDQLKSLLEFKLDHIK